VQKSFHIFDGGGERQRRHGGAVAVEGQNVGLTVGAILKYKNLTTAFGAQIKEGISCAPQEAGEIKIPRFKGPLMQRSLCLFPVQFSLYTLLKKRGLLDRENTLMGDFSHQQPKFLQPDAHGDG